ncbi:HAD-IA family hydrolase [Candidatus Uhrbacteria bacterium]|nr:HAD-IA family hydrolase [Candidatus Uhrbacteria bacterium]
MLKIKVIVTDVGGVLVDFDAGRMDQELASLYRTSLEAVRNWKGEPVNGELRWQGICRGVISMDTVTAELAQRFGMQPPDDSFRSAWLAGFRGLRLATLRLINMTRHRNELGLVSCTDVDPLYGSLLRGPGEILYSFFRAEVQSWLIGSLKPEPAMFRAAVAAAEVPISSCLFIDDVREHVEGARRFGLSAIHYSGDDRELAAALIRHGLVVNF